MATEKKPYRKFLKPCSYCHELVMSDQEYGVTDGRAWHKACKAKAEEDKKEEVTA